MTFPIFAAASLALAVAACNAGPAYADEAPAPAVCRFSYVEAVSMAEQSAAASGVRFVNFSLSDSRKMIDAINAMPPTDITFTAERLLALVHDEDGFTAIVLVHDDCVVKAGRIPMKQWRELQRDALGDGA